MPRFLPKPVYTQGEITQILNAYEQSRATDRHGQRKIWNRKNTRTLLLANGVEGAQRGPGCKRFYTFKELKAMARDVVDSMMDLDAYEDAQAA